MLRWLTSAAVLAALLAAPPSLRGQAFSPVDPRESPLERIDQAVEDVGPLSRSLRAVEFRREPRTPTAFGDVYALRDRSRFYRFDGALAASLPRSVYASGEDGLLPIVPAGTVFYIGTPPELEEPGSGLQRRSPLSSDPAGNESLLLSRRLSLRLDGPGDGSIPWPGRNAGSAAGKTNPERSTLPAPTIWGSESYRRGRLAALLREAAEADAGATAR